MVVRDGPMPRWPPRWKAQERVPVICRRPSAKSMAHAHGRLHSSTIEVRPDAGHGGAPANIVSTEELNFPFWLGTSLLVLGARTAGFRLGDEGDWGTSTGLSPSCWLEGGDGGGGSMGFALFGEAQGARRARAGRRPPPSWAWRIVAGERTALL